MKNTQTSICKIENLGNGIQISPVSGCDYQKLRHDVSGALRALGYLAKKAIDLDDSPSESVDAKRASLEMHLKTIKLVEEELYGPILRCLDQKKVVSPGVE